MIFRRLLSPSVKKSPKHILTPLLLSPTSPLIPSSFPISLNLIQSSPYSPVVWSKSSLLISSIITPDSARYYRSIKYVYKKYVCIYCMEEIIEKKKKKSEHEKAEREKAEREKAEEVQKTGEEVERERTGDRLSKEEKARLLICQMTE
ncbi:hypothetical protein OROGR_008220 [Orobanche gracilis]